MFTIQTKEEFGPDSALLHSADHQNEGNSLFRGISCDTGKNTYNHMQSLILAYSTNCQYISCSIVMKTERS